MRNSNNKRKFRADVILIISVLLISALCFLFTEINKTEGEYVVVTIGNEEYGKYPLNIDKKITITVDDETKMPYNVLVIEGGKADVIDASCPDGVCVDHAPIKNRGETIVCLPNKTVVKIVGGENEVDTAA